MTELKYGRMVYMGDMGGSHFTIFDSLTQAQEGRHPRACGRGAYGPIYELTGRKWDYEEEISKKWSEVDI